MGRRLPLIIAVLVSTLVGVFVSGRIIPRKHYDVPDLPRNPNVPGRIAGVVKFDGVPPPPKKGKFSSNGVDIDFEMRDLLVDRETSGIQFAVIRLMNVSGPADTGIPRRATIAAFDHKFTPHVTVITPNSEVIFLNRDTVHHNLHAVPMDQSNMAFNRIAPPKSHNTFQSKYWREPEIVQVKCDIHPWMNAYVIVHDLRYVALTEKSGRFEIKGIPPGKYKVSIWQESLGDKPAGANAEGLFEVEVKDGAATDMGEVKFKAK